MKEAPSNDRTALQNCSHIRGPGVGGKSGKIKFGTHILLLFHINHNLPTLT